MLSQIRQISDGNYNTVFVKNKEQKFNLDKEIHDLECWKQSRNHVYRKEERELLAHLVKLRHQQEYLHQLDGERVRHHYQDSVGAESTTGWRQPMREFRGTSHPNISLGNAIHDHNTDRLPPRSPSISLPPVYDHKALHRTEAHTNICVVCQLPRRSSHNHGHHSEVCCCEHEGAKEETRNKGKRFSLAVHEEHGFRQPVQVGQRRHSLMMARLNHEKYEYKPHPPERNYGGKHHKDQHHAHHHKDQHHGHHHDGHTHGHQSHAHVHSHGHGHKHQNHEHQGHVHEQFGRHNHHGNHDGQGIPHHGMHHTPPNSPHRSSHHTLSQLGHHHASTPTHDHLQSAHVAGGHHDNQNGEARRRDHELHWDRHQVHKLRGLITDPHYKEQLEVEEAGRVYPWSSQYETNKASSEDFGEMKKCRYLRFSKLNLENMKENPEKEVEVFEKKESSS